MYFFTLILFFGSFSSYALPHLDLELTSDEYRKILKEHSYIKNRTSEDPAITYSLKLGDRLSKWIANINSVRTESTAIRLTSAQTRRAIPIETPNVYSPSIIQSSIEKIMLDMPESMKKVLTSNEELPSSLGISDETFIKHARLVDRNYQSAARFKSLNPYRSQYIQAAKSDVRGYYYLKKNNIGPEQLKESGAINPDQLLPIKEALTKICLNSGTTLENCKNKTESAFQNNMLKDFYNKYILSAEKNWNSFFVIPQSAARSDIKWQNNIMTVPFNTPSVEKFIPYLQNNTEEEFRYNNWGLRIQFGNYTNGPRLVFRPGVVPHVNGLGGNEIVMDSNQPIEEYESQWTIRHEFGHVLGLPDCYHEFYDVNLNAFVNYQLDTADLMCSRAGNMNERIYNELKKTYSKI